MRTHLTAAAAAAGSIAVVLSLAGCSFPHDPGGTLDRVRGGTLRVGVSENPPWTQWPGGAPALGEEGEPSGIEVELVSGFADSIDAEVVWVAGSEATLMTQLEEGELEVVIAGLHGDTPWASHGATTYPYATTFDDEGNEVAHVMATPLGENDLLTTLESFLLAQQVSA